jgi:hypothetical protein
VIGTEPYVKVVPTGKALAATGDRYGDGPSRSDLTKDVAAPELLTGTRTASVTNEVRSVLKK